MPEKSGLQSSKFLIPLLTVLAGIALGENSVKREPVAFGTFMEYGQIESGRDYAETGVSFRGAVEQRMGIYIIQRATVQDRLNLNIGVGGLFFYVPQSKGLEHTIGAKFGPGIAETNLIYRFGDVRNNFWLKAGYWPLKYNGDAKNLGEYLYRSGTYPGFLRTGSWSILNSAFYYAQGLQVHHEMLNGRLTQDFTLLMEREYYPNHDLTPTYLVNLKTGAFSLGAGASFHHLFAMKPSSLRPKNEQSAYLTFRNFPNASPVYEGTTKVLDSVAAGTTVAGLQSGLSKYETADPQDPTQTLNVVDAKYWTDKAGVKTAPLTQSQVDEVERMYCSVSDPNVCKAKEQIPDSDQALWRESTINRYAETQDYVFPRETYRYTHRGIKLMLMTSLDFRTLLGLENTLGPQDLRLYAEAAVLGVENQPFFYDDIRRRIPVMLGFNLPTFRLLDVLSVETEYYNSRYDNNIASYYQSSLPVPTIPQGLPWKPQLTAGKDKWQWSVYARKTMMESVSLFAQVANDHLRTFHPDFIRPVMGEVLSSEKDWYWMLRLDVSI